MKLRIDRPDDNHVTDLAPRVEIIGGVFKHEWGYALCLTSEDEAHVFLETEGFKIIKVTDILFHSF